MYESYVLDRYWLERTVAAKGDELVFEPIR